VRRRTHERNAHAFALASCGAARQSKSGSVIARHSDAHNVPQSATPQSTASSQALASRIDNASAFALSAERYLSPKSPLLVRSIFFRHQVMCYWRFGEFSDLLNESRCQFGLSPYG
jgi:hypothetical protein